MSKKVQHIGNAILQDLPNQAGNYGNCDVVVELAMNNQIDNSEDPGVIRLYEHGAISSAIELTESQNGNTFEMSGKILSEPKEFNISIPAQLTEGQNKELVITFDPDDISGAYAIISRLLVEGDTVNGNTFSDFYTIPSGYELDGGWDYLMTPDGTEYVGNFTLTEGKP